MLKLQSKGGKFDIVLSEASLKDVGGIKKNNVRSLSSAGRRKTKEVKGNRILPDTKDESPRVAKGKESRLITNAKPKDEKTERKATSKMSDKPSKDVQQRPPAGVSKASNLKKSNMNTTAKSKGTADVTSEQIKPKLSNEAGVITQSELMTIIESLKGGDASLLKSIAGIKEENSKSGSTKGESKQDGVPYAAMEASAASTSSGPLKSKDSFSAISFSESQTSAYRSPEQISPGLNTSSQGRAERIAMRSSFAVGAPGQVAYDYNQVNRERNKQWLVDLEKQIQEKKLLPMSDKERLARAMENPASVSPRPNPSNQRVEYVPAEVDGNRMNREDHSSLKGDLMDHDISYYSEADDSSMTQKSFARGQHSTKAQFELDEMERQKKKILEHQRAVEQQVEEKRRLKMVERERRIQEELKEEEKFAKEREQMALQYEQESRKQMEREEAERQRHEALQKSVLEAYDAAKREKLNARLQKLKARGHDVSKLEHNLQNDSANVNDGEISEIEKELSRLTIPSVSLDSVHVASSRSDKEFRPILNLTDDSYEEKGKERKKSKESMNKESKKPRNQKNNRSSLKNTQDVSVERNEGKDAQKQTKKVSTKRSSLDSKKHESQEPNQNPSVNKGSQKSTNKRFEGRSNVNKDSSKVNGLKKKTTNTTTTERLLINHDAVSGDDYSHISHSYDDVQNGLHGGVTPSITALHVDDFDNEDEFAYNRSSTVNLEEELASHRAFIPNQSRASYQHTKEESSNWEARTFPTERQQQILDQLQELRKGLLHKQREYERGTTPSAGEFVNKS